MLYFIWFIACALFVVFELLTTSLIFASFAVGALLAGVAGALSLDLVGQGLTFAVASVLAVFLFRPILAKRITTKNSYGGTNALALIGTDAIATQAVTNQSGLVKARGEIWSARSESFEIAAGQTVTITDIDGATLIVKPQEPTTK